MRRLSIFAAIICGFQSYLAQGSSIESCNKDSLQRCLSDNVETTTKCLEKMYGCGEYDLIIDLDPSLDRVVPYFQGSAYFSARISVASEALRCANNRKAKQKLIEYLTEKSQEFDEKGNFGSAKETNWVYHASRQLDEIDADVACVETAMTPGEIRRKAEQYTAQKVEALFIGKGDNTGLANDIASAKETYQMGIEDVITKASSVETQIKLRDTELEAGKVRSKQIVQQIRKIIGIQVTMNQGWVQALSENMTGGSQVESCQQLGDDSASQLNLQILTTADLKKYYECWEERTSAKYTELQTQIGVSDQNVYKNNTLRVAKDLLDEGQRILSYYEAIIPNGSPGSQNNEFRVLKQKLLDLEAELASQQLSDIESLWKSYGESQRQCRHPRLSPWFCN